MHETADATALAERIRRSGYTSAALEAIFGVSQATVSRLRNARIARVERHVRALDRHEADRSREGSLDECLAGLRRRAEVDPALRDLLFSLGRVMQDA